MPDSTPDYRGLRLVFAGTPDFAATHLRALVAAGANIVAVYTQPDRPAGRGKKLAPSPVKRVAEAEGLAVLQPPSLRDPEAQRQFAALGADVFVVVAYGLLIPDAVLGAPTYGCINVHASLLPRWRGAAPIQRAIEAGDGESGITIMQMDADLDTGAMLAKVSCAIAPDETGGSLHDKLAELGPPALLATLTAIAAGTANGEKQDDSQSCYARKLTKQDAQLDWRRPARELERQVRAFNPFPVAFSPLGDTQIRIWLARAMEENPGAPPGTIVDSGANTLGVATGEGILVIDQAQLPGKKPMAMADILRGNPQLFTPGRVFSGILP